MSGGIFLLQYVSAAPSAGVLEYLTAPVDARAPTIARYVDDERSDHGAIVEYCNDIDAAGVNARIKGATLTPTARYMCREISDSGPTPEQHEVLMIVAFNVPPERVTEIEEWYEGEHIPLLLRAPGWYRARRYHVVRQDGTPTWTHLALHELRDVAVLATSERAYARSTPWRARLEKESWFAAAGRFVYQRLDD